MLPNIFTIYNFSLKTLVIFALFALVTAGYFFWKKGREEHYDEFELMDAFFTAVLVGLFVGRVGYIIHEFPRIGFSVYKWLDFVTYPGVHGLTAVLASSWKLYRYSLQKKWDTFEILDFWSISVAVGLAILYIGLFFDGSYYGNETNLPVGVRFPGLFSKHHPTQLYLALLSGLLAVYLSKVEYRYRTFEWYRAGRKAAQTGFLISVFTIVAGLSHFIISFFLPPHPNVPFLDQVEFFAIFVIGIVLLIRRSGISIRKK